MKKFILLSIYLAICTAPAFSWGRVGHSTIAYIAEQNLTPAAKTALKEYMHRNSIVSVAVLNDILKKQMTVDMGCEFTDAPRVNTLPHIFEVKSGSFDVERRICQNMILILMSK